MAFGVKSDRYLAMIDQFGCKMTVSLRRDNDRQNSLPLICPEHVPQFCWTLFVDGAKKGTCR